MRNPARSPRQSLGFAFPWALLLIGAWAPMEAAPVEGPGRAIPAAVLRAVPQDAAAAAFYAGLGRSGTPAGPRSPLDLATFLVDRAHELGMVSQLDSTVRAWIDVFAATTAGLAHPNAVALFEVSAEPRADGGHQLAGLRAAAILHTRGDHADVEQRIRHLLNTYTNTDESTLSSRRTDDGTVFSVRDRRLPPWVVITWGPIGDTYVIAVGEGTFRRVAETIADPSGSLAAQSWFTPAFLEAGGKHASFALYVDFDALSDKADPVLTRKIDRVQTALRLGGAERGLWTFWYAGRALEAQGLLRREGRDERLAIAGSRLRSRVGPSLIPDEATRYAVIDCNPRALIQGIAEAYLASRSEDAQQKSRQFWRDLETRCDVSFDRDIFSHLGHTVVIHDYPQHPLRLPLARTVLARIDGEAEALRRRIDQLLECASEEFLQTGLLRLHHDADGVWYLQYGLLGPALVVTNDWMILSFSPTAVHQNVALTRDRLGSEAALPPQSSDRLRGHGSGRAPE